MKQRLIASLAIALLFSLSALAQDAPIVFEIGIAERGEQAGLDYLQNVLIPKFEEENPGVKVEMTILGWGMDAFLTRYIGDVAPDVLQIGGDRVGTYVDMIVPLDKYMADWEDAADFPPVLLEGGKVNGQQYGIPFGMAARTLLYRTDMFEEVGLDAAQPPATWEELVDYGRRLTVFAPNGEMIRQAYQMDDHWFEFAPWLFQAGGDFMSADRTRFTFGSPEGIEAVEMMRAIVNDYQIAHPTNELGAFEEHATAMEVDESAMFFLTEPDFTNVVDIAMPLRNKEQYGLAYADHWVMSNKTANPDLAWKWLAFVSRIDNMVGYTLNAKLMPPRLSSVRYEPWSSDARFQKVYQSAALSKPLPFDSPAIDQVRKQFIQPTLKRILYEGAPVNEIIEAERQANAYLEANF